MKRAGWAWAAVLTLCASSATLAKAQHAALQAHELGVSEAELIAWSEALASPAREEREQALGALLELGEDALPAIQARLRSLRAPGPPSPALRVALQNVLRTKHSGGTRAQLSQALEEDLSPTATKAVELLALGHALESQRSRKSFELLLNELFVLEPRALRAPLLRAFKRGGRPLALTLVRARSAPEPSVQRFAREALVSLQLASVDAQFELATPADATELLALYASQRDKDVLPWALAYLTHGELALQTAAQDALKAFGALATPAVAAYLADKIGQEPPPNLTTSDLLVMLPSSASAAGGAPTPLERAEKSLARGDGPATSQALDEALQRPLTAADTVKISALYGKLALHHDARDRPRDALLAARRALRLSPHAAHAEKTRALVLYLEAEQRSAEGVADLPRLEQALALDPKLTPATKLLDELSGARSQRDRQLEQRAGLAAAGLLALAALLLLRNRKQVAEDAPEQELRAGPSSS